jgi:hypothetical protein
LAGESYIKHVPSEWIADWLQAEQFTATAVATRSISCPGEHDLSRNHARRVAPAFVAVRVTSGRRVFLGLQSGTRRSRQPRFLGE